MAVLAVVLLRAKLVIPPTPSVYLDRLGQLVRARLGWLSCSLQSHWLRKTLTLTALPGVRSPPQKGVPSAAWMCMSPPGVSGEDRSSYGLTIQLRQAARGLPCFCILSPSVRTRASTQNCGALAGQDRLKVGAGRHFLPESQLGWRRISATARSSSHQAASGSVLPTSWQVGNKWIEDRGLPARPAR